MLEPEIFDFIPEGQPVDFSGESFPEALAAGKPLYGYVAEGYWEDVGTLEAYLKAHQDILDEQGAGRHQRLPAAARGLARQGRRDRPDRVRSTARRSSATTASIGPGRRLGEYCTLGRNVRIGDNAVLAALGGPRQRLPRARGSASTAACWAASRDLRQGVRCEEGVVLGDECFVGAHAEIKAGVKVYPFKTVEAGAIVNSSIVWESMGARSLFGRDGVQGLANVDISPELAVRLSMAWASTFEKGATVTTSRDTSRAARVLKRAIMVGCNAAGVNVDDLEVATVPVTRFQVDLVGTPWPGSPSAWPPTTPSRW